MLYTSIASAYGEGVYGKGLYSQGSTTEGGLADTGLLIIGFVTLACLFIFVALLVRFARRRKKFKKAGRK